MKEFILEENEEILATFNDVLVKANENNFKLSVVLTNTRIVLKNGEEIKLIIPLSEIKELKYIDGINKITFKDNNNDIDLECDDFKSYLINLD